MMLETPTTQIGGIPLLHVLHVGILPLRNHCSDADPLSLVLRPTHILCYCLNSELCTPSLYIQRAYQELPEVAVGKGDAVSVVDLLILSRHNFNNRLSEKVLRASCV